MGSVYQRGNSWVGQYKVHGKTVQKTLGKKSLITKTMAREILKKIEHKIKLGKYDMLETDVLTLREISKIYIYYVKDTLKRKSWYRYEYSLKGLLSLYGYRKLTEITPKDIDDFKEIRLKSVQPSTVNRELSTLRQIYNFAKRRNQYYGENPVSISRLLPEENIKERILTGVEEDKLLSSSNEYLKPIIVSALQTGMRKSEILTLKWSDVDLNNRIITISQTNTKNKKMRKVPINSVLRTLLYEQKLKSGTSEYVFLSQNGSPYKFHYCLNNAFRSACKKAGITGFRFHDLRHTAATRMVEAGASIVAVSKILGHSDIKITMRYSHPENSLVQALELLANKNLDSTTDKSTDISQN